jgi:hypothetical protein
MGRNEEANGCLIAAECQEGQIGDDEQATVSGEFKEAEAGDLLQRPEDYRRSRRSDDQAACEFGGDDL